MASVLIALIYISFVSLGLPDAVLGAAWPVMHPDLGASISDMGILSMTMSFATIISSLNAEHMTARFGTAKVTAFSVGVTAMAILGFSYSNSFWALFLWAIPYGLGAGCVDASLNNYVAIHYASSHMSWLHCMWGIGACTGPYIMGYALTSGLTWDKGYFYIGLFQVVLFFVLLVTVRIWKVNEDRNDTHQKRQRVTVKHVFSIHGVFQILLSFFAYCAIEQTAGQWASSYLVLKDGMEPELAAGYASLFYLGITLGRAASGFLALRLNDRQMIRLGQSVLTVGILILFLSLGSASSMVALSLIGLGCAPIYPCVIHSTPAHFGKENSQAVIGLQMAFAYAGTLLMPPLYGLIAQHISATLLPVFLMLLLAIMIGNLELLNKKHKKEMDL